MIEIKVTTPESVSKQPFLSIVTRCYKRPVALKRNIDSIRSQTDADYEQILIIDNVGVGVKRANYFFWEFREKISGKFVYILDDDDFLIDTDFIKFLKKEVRKSSPDMIITRHKSLGDPNPRPRIDTDFGVRIVGCNICSPCLTVRREVWYDNIIEFYSPNGIGLCGDYFFSHRVLKGQYVTTWHDRIVSESSFVGLGESE